MTEASKKSLRWTLYIRMHARTHARTCIHIISLIN